MNLLHEESGQALIEFAFTVSIFVLVLAGMVDYVIYIRDKMELAEAAAAAAAYGTTPGTQKSANWPTSIYIMEQVALQTAPDVKNVSAAASYFYTCTPGGVQVPSTTVCSRANYTTPLMYVTVQTSADVPAAFRWSQLATTMSLKASATYRVPWTQ